VSDWLIEAGIRPHFRMESHTDHCPGGCYIFKGYDGDRYLWGTTHHVPADMFWGRTPWTQASAEAQVEA
jgi:hypothetical protein